MSCQRALDVGLQRMHVIVATALAAGLRLLFTTTAYAENLEGAADEL